MLKAAVALSKYELYLQEFSAHGAEDFLLSFCLIYAFA